jgi:hypothetical protein
VSEANRSCTRDAERTTASDPASVMGRFIAEKPAMVRAAAENQR